MDDYSEVKTRWKGYTNTTGTTTLKFNSQYQILTLHLRHYRLLDTDYPYVCYYLFITGVLDQADSTVIRSWWNNFGFMFLPILRPLWAWMQEQGTPDRLWAWFGELTPLSCSLCSLSRLLLFYRCLDDLTLYAVSFDSTLAFSASDCHRQGSAPQSI